MKTIKKIIDSRREQAAKNIKMIAKGKLKDYSKSEVLDNQIKIGIWTQNLTLLMDIVNAAPQKTQNSPQESDDQTPRALLAGCSLAEPSLAEPSLAKPSLAEPSLAEPSLAEPSCDQLAEYDWWN